MITQKDKLDICLKETINFLKTRKEISQINLNEFEEFQKETNSEFEGLESKLDSFRQLVWEYSIDRSKYETEVSNVKSSLLLAVDQLNTLITDMNLQENESKFGSRLGAPNEEFLDLLRQGILTTEDKLYLDSNGKKIYSSLTDSGYLKMEINGKLFSSPTTAASYAHNKTKTNGWELWKINDETDIARELEFYRKQITYKPKTAANNALPPLGLDR